MRIKKAPVIILGVWGLQVCTKVTALGVPSRMEQHAGGDEAGCRRAGAESGSERAAAAEVYWWNRRIAKFDEYAELLLHRDRHAASALTRAAWYSPADICHDTCDVQLPCTVRMHAGAPQQLESIHDSPP